MLAFGGGLCSLSTSSCHCETCHIITVSDDYDNMHGIMNKITFSFNDYAVVDLSTKRYSNPEVIVVGE